MSYKNYPTFNDIDDVTLRTWNRCAFATNLLDDKGEAESAGYLGQFDTKSKKQMMVMFRYIQIKGHDYTKAKVMRGAGSMEA